MTVRKPNAPMELFNQKDHIGDLLLVRVRSYGEWPPIKSGDAPRPYAQCDIVVLTDGNGPPADEPKVLEGRLSGNKLLPQIDGAVGEWQLGRLIRGEAQGSKSPPYLLEDPDEKLEQIADEWLAAHPDA